jgi:hypothetical protein
MPIAELCLAVRNSDFFTAVRQSAIVYPSAMATHLACIAVFGGMILATDLRLLGLAFRRVPVASIIESTRWWKRGGFCVMAGCGVLLAGSKLNDYYVNPWFQFKLLLLCAIAVHGLIFRGVYRTPADLDRAAMLPMRARLAGGTSLILWLSVLACGRWIAYWDAPGTITRLTGSQLPL